MKAAGVALTILSGLILLTAIAGEITQNPVSPTTVIVGAILLAAGLIVWSLQQIREALIGGHPRDVAAGVDEHGYKAVRPVGRKPKWQRSTTEQR